ncbi:MAG: hypothetical protein K0Q73_8977 [Paenibacillus sp.]|nr:hypothetical protein [Paenibacillus sp.]
MTATKTCTITKKCVTKVKGNFKKRKLRKPSNSILKRLKVLSLKVAQLKRRVNNIVAAINNLNTQVNTLQAQVLEPIIAVRNVLLARVGKSVTIQTAVGSVSGTVVTVGANFVRLLEPSGAIVFIPLSKINTIS